MHFYRYVIYKLPKQVSHRNVLIKEGLAFMYMSSKDYSKWVLSEIDINDTQSMVAHTLKGLYDNQDKQVIIYNTNYSS